MRLYIHQGSTVYEKRSCFDFSHQIHLFQQISNWRKYVSHRAALKMIRDAGYDEIKVDMAETVEMVHRSGGVALIVHPGRGQYEPEEFTDYTPHLLDQVRVEIPLDGIEVYYPTHPLERVQTYLAYAKQHELLIGAGSDLHGPPGRMPKKYRAELCQHLLERLGIQVQ